MEKTSVLKNTCFGSKYMKKLIYHSGLIFLISFLSYQIIVFIESTISSTVGPGEFGQYKFLIRFVHGCSHLLLLGQDYALFYFLSKYLKEKKPGAYQGYFKWIFTSLIKRSILFVLAIIWLHYETKGVVTLDITLGSVIVPIICVDTILNKHLLFHKAYLRSFIPRAILQSSSFTFFIFALLYFEYPLTTEHIILSYGASFLVCCLAYYLLSLPFAKPHKTNDSTNKKQWVSNGLHFSISTFVITQSRSVIYFLVKFYEDWAPSSGVEISESTLGYLGTITTITFSYHLYTKGIELYLKPIITRHLESGLLIELQQEIIHANRIRYLIVWAITLGICLFPEHYLYSWGDDNQYMQIIPELLTCAVLYHVYTICQPALDYMIFGGHQKLVSRLLQIKFLSICLLAYFLIPQYGLMGAVIADSLPAALSALAAAIWVRKHGTIRPLALL
jgi:O-antigen/teichoic acid export membrane protein